MSERCRLRHPLTKQSSDLLYLGQAEHMRAHWDTEVGVQACRVSRNLSQGVASTTITECGSDPMGRGVGWADMPFHTHRAVGAAAAVLALQPRPERVIKPSTGSTGSVTLTLRLSR